MPVAILLSASSHVCQHHGPSPESQTACYTRISQPITDHRNNEKAVTVVGKTRPAQHCAVLTPLNRPLMLFWRPDFPAFTQECGGNHDHNGDGQHGHSGCTNACSDADEKTFWIREYTMNTKLKTALEAATVYEAWLLLLHAHVLTIFFFFYCHCTLLFFDRSPADPATAPKETLLGGG